MAPSTLNVEPTFWTGRHHTPRHWALDTTPRHVRENVNAFLPCCGLVEGVVRSVFAGRDPVTLSMKKREKRPLVFLSSLVWGSFVPFGLDREGPLVASCSQFAGLFLTVYGPYHHPYFQSFSQQMEAQRETNRAVEKCANGATPAVEVTHVLCALK